MKCPYCGERKFRVVSRAYETIEFDERDNAVTISNLETEEIIEEEGYLCLNCNKNIKSENMIKNEFHIRI